MTSPPPRVSVCIRTFDRPRALHAAIASVLDQSYENLEIVVSDDSGRHGNVARAFDDQRVRYHPNPRPAGATANLLHAVGHARGQLLAVLDDDDRWLPSFLATAVARFDDDPQLGVVFTGQHWIAGGRRIPRSLPCAAGRHDTMLQAILDHSIPPSAALMRREAWEQGERQLPLRPDMAGALTVWLRTAAAGWPFYYVDEPLAEYCLHSGQMSWSGTDASARCARTLACFSFPDEETERLRRARLAEALLTQAGLQLRHGRVRPGGRLIRHAAAVSPAALTIRGMLAVSGVRRPLAHFVAGHPRALAAALPVWGRLRPRI
jgi:hypothetical protein